MDRPASKAKRKSGLRKDKAILLQGTQVEERDLKPESPPGDGTKDGMKKES